MSDAALGLADFPAFFREVHGVEPFPWQCRLARRLAETGTWPQVLDLPTGSGKTATLDLAVFHLALEVGKGPERRAPVRIALVVDRRLVVDDSFARAERLARALARAEPSSVTGRVAARLRRLAGAGEPPLCAVRLRGGLPREADWARTPVQPTILCSTVDQVGSRLLFRGYGVSDAMKPVHAGLLGSDCLVLLDEAHLAEPFRRTLEAVARYRDPPWRGDPYAGPWATVLLTATPGAVSGDRFALTPEDEAHPVLGRRLRAAKPVRLVKAGARRRTEAGGVDELDERAELFLQQLHEALRHFQERGVAAPAIALVLNRVARARRCFERVREAFGEDALDAILLVGPQRPADREGVATALVGVRTGAPRDRLRPLVVVSTQGIEAGVDLDFDGLVSELAPLDSLRQRFGRLNRDGREIEPFGAVLVFPRDLDQKVGDPIYGRSLPVAYAQLQEAARPGAVGVEFGTAGFAVALPSEALAPKPQAPHLLPAHLDLFARTSPVPVPDPPVAAFLHGREREPDAVTVLWRADFDPELLADEDAARLLALVPPRVGETIELPVWAVRRWLEGVPEALVDLADVAGRPRTDGGGSARHRIYRWTGDPQRARWIGPAEIRPGDTIVVPAFLGGLDRWGWNPTSREPVVDVAGPAAEPFAGRRFAVRVAPGLLGAQLAPERVAEVLAAGLALDWRDLRDRLLELPLPEETRTGLLRLDGARRGRVEVNLGAYGEDEDGRPRGVVFRAPLGLEEAVASELGAAASEDDLEGSLSGVTVELPAHCRAVAEKVRALATAAGLPRQRVADLELAGRLHDAGKVDPRFQSWLRGDDPLGFDPEEPVAPLAKSSRPQAPPGPRTELPARWRHEALSVRLALLDRALAEAADPELVCWLVGTHHGYGRPLFPHADPQDRVPRRLPGTEGGWIELPAGAGPQSPAFDWHGYDWPSLFAALRERYGVWELARLEAFLRLADHRVSEDERP